MTRPMLLVLTDVASELMATRFDGIDARFDRIDARLETDR